MDFKEKYERLSHACKMAIEGKPIGASGCTTEIPNARLQAIVGELPDMTKLKKCPRCDCGRVAAQVDDRSRRWEVKCQTCSYAKGKYYVKEQAVKDWNEGTHIIDCYSPWHCGYIADFRKPAKVDKFSMEGFVTDSSISAIDISKARTDTHLLPDRPPGLSVLFTDRSVGRKEYFKERGVLDALMQARNMGFLSTDEYSRMRRRYIRQLQAWINYVNNLHEAAIKEDAERFPFGGHRMDNCKFYWHHPASTCSEMMDKNSAINKSVQLTVVVDGKHVWRRKAVGAAWEHMSKEDGDSIYWILPC